MFDPHTYVVNRMLQMAGEVGVPPAQLAHALLGRAMAIARRLAVAAASNAPPPASAGAGAAPAAGTACPSPPSYVDAVRQASQALPALAAADVAFAAAVVRELGGQADNLTDARVQKARLNVVGDAYQSAFQQAR